MKRPSFEDYLKYIYRLEQDKPRVTTTRLAQKLNVSPASASEMVKRLAAESFVQLIPYHGVRLTPKGRKAALHVVRRHRLWEMFLVQFLHYPWDKVHEEAERLEHSTSPELERRIDEMLEFPTIDPHGDPIPSIEGKFITRSLKPLSSLKEGETAAIVRVDDDHPEMLAYFQEVGMTLRRRIRILKRMEIDGSLVVRVGRHRRYLSRELASRVFVQIEKRKKGKRTR